MAIPELLASLVKAVGPSGHETEPARVWRDWCATFATEVGGRASHTAIMAGVLEIPAVVGLGRFLTDVSGGDEIIVDGNRGVVILNPDDETREHYEIARKTHGSFATSLNELKELVGKITRNSLSSIVSLFGGFMIIAALMILISLAFMPQLGLRPTYMSILRVALCSMAFYASAMLCFNFLLFLDLRRPALWIVSTFLVLNATLTAALLPLGPSFYGYGNLIASAVSLLVGFVLLLKELPWLHYHAFVTNNISR